MFVAVARSYSLPLRFPFRFPFWVARVWGRLPVEFGFAVSPNPALDSIWEPVGITSFITEYNLLILDYGLC